MHLRHLIVHVLRPHIRLMRDSLAGDDLAELAQSAAGVAGGLGVKDGPAFRGKLAMDVDGLRAHGRVLPALMDVSRTLASGSCRRLFGPSSHAS
jgi:hypothetical protein